MKKQLLRLLSFNLVLIGSAAIAQPTLTATGCNPTIGNSFTFTQTAHFSEGGSGASQTWNFATLTGTAGAPANVVSVGSTPNGASYPSATVAIDQGGGAYGYYKTSSSAYQNYGTVSGTTSIIYSNPEDMLHFPFTYLNTSTDPFAASFTSGGYTFVRKGNTTITADAYGTLITPAGTFNNVTRVHMVEAYQDSTFIGMPYVITYNNDEYLWYADGTHTALAATFTLTNSVSGPTTAGVFLSATVTGVEENQYVSSLNLFPNPAVNAITLDVNLTENKTIEARIYNVAGQLVNKGLTTEGVQGANALTVNISELPQGIYYAQVKVGGSVAETKRFVVSK